MRLLRVSVAAAAFLCAAVAARADVCPGSVPLSAQFVGFTSVTCHGAANGTIEFAGSGGIPPYTYLWSPSGATTSVATNLSGGPNTVTVTDSCGTQAQGQIDLPEPAAITTAIGPISNVSVRDACNGSAQVNVAGGTGFFTYAWSPSGSTANPGFGLCAGTHSVVVSEGSHPSCQATQNGFVLTQPPSAPTANFLYWPGDTFWHLLVLYFNPPADDGGSPITGYVADCSGYPGTGPANENYVTLTGLPNGVLLDCKVAATNANGQGAWSNIVQGRAVGPPEITSISVPAAKTWTIGEVMTFGVNFDQLVECNCWADLTIQIGSQTRVLRTPPQDAVIGNFYGFGFNYTVQFGDYDADGITVVGFTPHGLMRGYYGVKPVPLSPPLNNVGDTSGVLVNAALPIMSVTPPALDYGSVNLGSTGGPRAFVVTNTGVGPLSVTPSVTGDFSAAPAPCFAVAIDPGNSCTLNVSFVPTVAGLRTGSVNFSGNGYNSTSASYPVQGTGVALTYALVLQGLQQVSPYVDTAATGGGTATYNAVSRELAFNLSYSGLSSAETMAHIHGQAARGANAGIQVDLAGWNPASKVVTLSPAQETMLFAKQLYVNIHTTNYPNGELRAQIDNDGAAPKFTLAVTKAGGGSGTVTATTEAGTVVNCGSDCTAAIPLGKSATLTAAAASGSVFDQWTGCDSTAGNQCTIAMNADRNPQATFLAITTFNLVVDGWQMVPYVVGVGTGSGTTIFNPVTRQLTFDLTYAGLTGLETGSWIGGPAARGANGPVVANLSSASHKVDVITLTPQQATNLAAGQLYVVIATAAHPNGEIRAQLDNLGGTARHPLTVSVPGGNGSVTGTTEAGAVINCGVDCTEMIPVGKTATLTAVPAPNQGLSQWTGCDSVSGYQCTVTMNGPRSVSATFIPASTWTFPLEGFQVTTPTIPFVSTPATGTGTAIYVPQLRELALNLDYSNLTGPEITAELHGPANRFAVAPKLRDLPAGNPKTAFFVLTPEEHDMIYQGKLYIDIRTAAHPNGELRGQVDSHPAIPAGTLNVSKSGTGTGTVSLVVDGTTIIDCGSVCSGTVPNDNRQIKLTATASPGSGLASWSSCTIPSGNQCTTFGTLPVGAVFDLAPTYNLVLEGWQERPAWVVTPATGGGTATFDPATRQLTLNLSYSGLTGTETGAHIHGPASRIGNAPNAILHTLGAGSPKTDVVTLSPSQVTSLLTGFLYIDIHTTAFPNGEIRAQLDNVGAVPRYTVTVAKVGNGTVIGFGDNGTIIDCGSKCSEIVPQGRYTGLAATAATGYTFSGWSGACTGTGICNLTVDAAKNVTATFTANAPPNPPRLGNISTRMQVLTGNDVMIGGFVIGGSASKTVAIVATGPSLAAYGITNPLANPKLTLVRSSDQAVIATNDDWQGGCPQGTACANPSQLTAAGFAPSNPLEAAMYITLPPGAYTAIVEGVGGGTGVSVIGVYEVDGPTIPLTNISTRGRVLTGNDVMIGGFIINGTGPQTVAIVATGPSLTQYGITNALANPKVTLVRSSDQAVIDSNDDWQAHANASQLQAAGFAPSNTLEAAIYITLPPGAYTAIVEGVGGGTGVAVIGVYRVD